MIIASTIVTFIILNILGLYTFSWWHLLWMIPVLVDVVVYEADNNNDRPRVITYDDIPANIKKVSNKKRKITSF